MTLKYILGEKVKIKLPVFDSQLRIFRQKKFTPLVLRKMAIFRRKLVKIGGKNYHNIDPRSQY
jgi:hypothetical protein